MTDSKAPAAPAAPSEFSRMEDLFKGFLERIEPSVMKMAQDAVKVAAPPIVGPVASMVLDSVDQMIRAHNPSIAQAEANTANPPQAQDLPDDVDKALDMRLTALEAHVAALTVVTANDTNATFVATKAAIVAQNQAAAAQK